MMNGNSAQKRHNHLYPAFHIRKWRNRGGKLYNKESGTIRKIRAQDFSEDFYYSNGKEDSALEDRLAHFEEYVAPLIKRVDESEERISLTGKELEILKLYCVLCADRHHNMSEVIKEDESGLYESNRYLFGVHRAENPELAVAWTERLIEDFERLKNEDDAISSPIDPDVLNTDSRCSPYTFGLHLVIARCDTPSICISDRFGVIENTMDSDFLYVYLPISPVTALLLVKSKYYLTKAAFNKTKRHFGNKYGYGVPDPYISEIFYGFEEKLFCSYATARLNVLADPAQEVPQRTAKQVTILIQTLPKSIVRAFNSIFCEDGEKILFCEQEELDIAINNPLPCRSVTVF